MKIGTYHLPGEVTLNADSESEPSSHPNFGACITLEILTVNYFPSISTNKESFMSFIDRPRILTLATSNLFCSLASASSSTNVPKQRLACLKNRSDHACNGTSRHSVQTSLLWPTSSGFHGHIQQNHSFSHSFLPASGISIFSFYKIKIKPSPMNLRDKKGSASFWMSVANSTQEKFSLSNPIIALANQAFSSSLGIKPTFCSGKSLSFPTLFTRATALANDLPDSTNASESDSCLGCTPSVSFFALELTVSLSLQSNHGIYTLIL